MRLLLPVLLLAATLAGPALAADKTVPDGAAGALEPYRGKPWAVPLNNCAGFHTWNGRRLQDAGDSQGSWTQASKAAEFLAAAATRYSEDQGLTYDQGVEKAKPRIANAVKALDLAIQGDDFLSSWTRTCDQVLSAYRKAFG